ncbi:MAG: hypothetical protein Ct9H90mP11_08700 [Acidimicrobiales bacterium]|nr:MAG: hypothetical protein Ct9H90mP11_08700 [Acidimicrobiales bacterium]
MGFFQKPPTNSKAKKSAVSALKGSLKSAFGGHKSDLISLGLIVIGIVAALVYILIPPA